MIMIIISCHYLCVYILSTDETCKLACENGGRCVINEKGDQRCYCWPSYSGDRCEINHCNNYCQNGGTCIASVLGKYFFKFSLFIYCRQWKTVIL